MHPSRQNKQTNLRKSKLGWILIGLVLGVLVLSILAFFSPVSQGWQETTPTPTAYELTPTNETEAPPPTPEEIGYTDGIIFMSTLLILILLIGTLREILRRKGR